MRTSHQIATMQTAYFVAIAIDHDDVTLFRLGPLEISWRASPSVSLCSMSSGSAAKIGSSLMAPPVVGGPLPSS
jgi:hypothetical protein